MSLRLIDGASGAVLQSHAHAYEYAPAMRRGAQDAIVIAAAETVQVQLTEGEQALHYFSLSNQLDGSVRAHDPRVAAS